MKILRAIYIRSTILILGILVFSFLSFNSWASEEINGIYYNLNSSDRTAQVAQSGLLYKGKVVIPESFVFNGITYSVTSIGEYAFYGCSELTSVSIPSSVKTLVDKSFSECTGLTSVTIPNSVTSIGQAVFRGCTGLTSVKISNQLTTISRMAFYDCSGLTSVTIPNGVTTLDDFSFCGCASLTSIAIPSSVNNIGSRAFSGCSGLISIMVNSNNSKYDSRDNCNAIIETATNKLVVGCKKTSIPSSVTTIGDDAFFDCSALTSIVIPKSVTTIESFVFGGCTGLTSITCESETPASVTYSSFESFDYSNCILYVPFGSKTAYENAAYWSDFQDIIEYEPDTDISTLDNAIYVEQVDGLVGGTMDIPVKMKSDFDVRGFQFTMELPDGATINSWQVNPDRLPSGISASKVLPMERIEGNRIVATCVLNDGNKTFTGYDGVIATVNVTFGSDMATGTYPIYLSEASISDASSTNQKVLSDIKATLVLDDYVVGDTNGDGKVLVGDVISILNYIVGERPEGFNEKAADVNSDGKILVGDVIAVLNIIVGL